MVIGIVKLIIVCNQQNSRQADGCCGCCFGLKKIGYGLIRAQFVLHNSMMLKAPFGRYVSEHSKQANEHAYVEQLCFSLES